MDAKRLADDSIELTMSRQEVYWLTGVINECCHGFRIADFVSRIGTEKSTVVKILDEILAA